MASNEREPHGAGPEGDEGRTVDRRSFLAASAAGAVAAATVPAAISRAAVGDDGEDAREIVRAGHALGGGWTIERVEPVRAGAIQVVVAHHGQERVANLTICRAESGSGALATTGRLDVFLMNDGGDGRRYTPDEVVRVARSFARELDGAERTLPGAAQLLGRQQRLRAYAPIDHLDPMDP